jgi:hypothetical protein
MTAGGVNAIRKRAVCRPFGKGNLRFDGEAYSLLAMEWWLSPGLRSFPRRLLKARFPPN